jgi:hypothetical protein
MCGNKCGGQTCMAGTCMGGGCNNGLTSCGGGCTDTLTDPLHCGGCNMACAPTESCADGVCG